MIAEQPVQTNSRWLPTTRDKVPTYLDKFLINYHQDRVRLSTCNLLLSLYKRGNDQQKKYLLDLLLKNSNFLTKMGKSSQQFLKLIQLVFQASSQKFKDEQKQIFESILQATQKTFESMIKNPKYNFYAFCSNMIDFQGPFKPYLLEHNGCENCYGHCENDFEAHKIDHVLQEYKLHLNKIEYVLNRTYDINDLNITMLKNQKNPCKSISVYYLDDKGEKKLAGKYQKENNAQNITVPKLSFTTSSIFIELKMEGDEDLRRRRATTVCCGKRQQECQRDNCRKGIEIDGKFKVVSADNKKVASQLCQQYKKIKDYTNYLHEIYFSYKGKKQVKNFKYVNITEMDKAYQNIMKNMLIIGQNNQKNQSKMMFLEDESTNCFSCSFYQTENLINFFKELASINSNVLDLSGINKLKDRLKFYLKNNKIAIIRTTILGALACLYAITLNMDYQSQFAINQTNKDDIVYIITNMYLFAKDMEHKQLQLKTLDQDRLLKHVIKKQFIQNLSRMDRIVLFVSIHAPRDCIGALRNAYISTEKLNNIERLTSETIQAAKPLIDFNLQQLFYLNLNNYLKIFFQIIPTTILPYSNLQITNPQFLNYIQIEVPTITPQYLKKNLVYNPYPTLKMNCFEILPQMIKKMKIEEGMKLIQQICSFRNIWNLNLFDTLTNFDEMISAVPKEQQLLLSLQGYDSSQQNMYLDKIYQILVPQRMKFIIKMDVPDAISRDQRSRQGGTQYSFLLVRQVKSDDLQGDTMQALRDWVKKQLKKVQNDMMFNLIVEGNIIDDLSLPIEVVYKKLITKQTKKQIGKTNYNVFRVIYGIMGVYQGNEKGANISGDEKKDQCLACSDYLLEKINPKAQINGLDVIMNIVGKLKLQQQKKRQKIFQILQMIFKNPAIRKKLVEQQKGDILINQTIKFLSFNSQKQIDRSQLLLDICSKTIDQANKQLLNLRKKSINARKMSEMVDEANQGSTQSQKAVQYIFSKVKECENNPKKDMIQKLIKLLPFCSKDEYKTCAKILNYFQFDRLLQGKFITKMAQVCTFFDALQQGYTSIKTLCRENKLNDLIIEKIKNCLSDGQIDRQKILNNQQTLQGFFHILKGLIKGNQPLQAQLFNHNLISVIEYLSKNRIGTITTNCYDICEYFQKGHIVDNRIKQFFQQKQQQIKKTAGVKIKSKFEIMKQKMQAARKTHLNNYNQIDEGEIICLKCKQGYETRKEILGLYVYSTENQIIGLEKKWWCESVKMLSITSISYFSIIHFECHKEAMQQDRKNHKSQWEGAIVRNSQAKCNNWIPFKGPKTTDEQFDRVFNKYFEKCKNGNFWNAMNDLNGLIYRLSIQYHFGKEGHGSSSLHNCKLIPVILGFGAYLLKKYERQSRDEHQNLIRLIKDGITHLKNSKLRKSNIFRLYLTISLFFQSYQSFQKLKPQIWKMITELYGKSEENFNEKKPDLIFLNIVNKIFEMIHKKATIKQQEDAYLGLDQIIPQKFAELAKQFEKLSEQFYKKQLLTATNQNTFQTYFGL